MKPYLENMRFNQTLLTCKCIDTCALPITIWYLHRGGQHSSKIHNSWCIASIQFTGIVVKNTTRQVVPIVDCSDRYYYYYYYYCARCFLYTYKYLLLYSSCLFLLIHLLHHPVIRCFVYTDFCPLPTHLFLRPGGSHSPLSSQGNLSHKRPHVALRGRAGQCGAEPEQNE